MNLSIERYQILKSTKKKNSKTYLIKNKKKFIYDENNAYKIITYNKFFMNNSNITNNSKLFNTSSRNYETVLRRNIIYIRKQKIKKLHFLPENLDFYMRKKCTYHSKKRLSEDKSLENYKENNKNSNDSNNNKNLNITNNSNNYFPNSDDSSNLNIKVKKKNCLLRNIKNNISNNSNIKKKKCDNASNFENGNLNNDTELYKLSSDLIKDKKKKKKFNYIKNYNSHYIKNDLSRKKLKFKNINNSCLLESNRMPISNKMKKNFKINNKKTNEILLNNKKFLNIDLSLDQNYTNEINSSKYLNKASINNNDIIPLENNKKLIKNEVDLSLFNDEEKYSERKNIESKENLRKDIFEILSKYNLICDINKYYDIIEKRKSKNILNSKNYTDSEIEKYMLSKNKTNADKDILGDFYINKCKGDYFYINKDNTKNNFKNIIIKDLGFKKRIVNSFRCKDCSNEILNEKLRDDLSENPNVCCHLDKNVYTSVPRNIKILSGFSNYEKALNEQKGNYESNLNNIINNFNLFIDYSSLSTCSLNNVEKKQNNKIIHTNENSTNNEKKNSEINIDYKNIKPIKKNFINKTTMCDYNINNINMCESTTIDKEKTKNKEKLKKNKNLKRNLDNDLRYNSNKKVRNYEYSLINFNIYKNNVTDICKNNSYNTYVLKSLGNSYLKNKLNCKDTKVKNVNAPVVNTFNGHSNKFNSNIKDIFNYKNKKFNESGNENFKARLIKNEINKKLDNTKIIINSNEENNYMKQEQKYDKNDRENIDNYKNDNKNVKYCKVNNFINTKKNSFEKKSINDTDHSVNHEINYAHFLKDKNIDIFDLDLYDIVKLLEKERIENLYSEEELKKLLIPVSGVYYDENKKNWICKYIDLKNMNYDELSKYFLLKEQNNVENWKKKIFSAKSCSYHESRQLALEFKYKHAKKKYNILKNLSEEENMFFESTSYSTENEKYIKFRDKNKQDNDMKKGELKKEQNGVIREVEQKKEETKKSFCCDNKMKNCNLCNNTNKNLSNINQINLNQTLKVLKNEVTHELHRPLLNANGNEDDSINVIKTDKNKNNCSIDMNIISNSDITNFNDCNNVVASNDKYCLVNQREKFDNYNKIKNYTYEDDQSYINFEKKKNLCKLLGVNLSNDIEEKMKNLYKENIFYEKEEKKWVIKIYEKKNNILLYFKEFDCRVFGFLYACYLCIEHKRLYLDYFLNEKNYNFLIKLVYRNFIKSNIYNTITRQINLNKNHNYSLKDNEIKRKSKVKNSEKDNLEPKSKENEYLETNTLEKNNIETKNLEATYIKTDFEEENLIFYNTYNNYTEKLKDHKNKNYKKVEKDNIIIDEKINPSNFQNTKNESSNKLNDISCYLEKNFEKNFKTMNPDLKSYQSIKYTKHNHDIENEKKQVESIEEKEEQKEPYVKAIEEKENGDDRKKEESYNLNTNNSITLSLNFDSNNSANENNSSNMDVINLSKNYTIENNEVSNVQVKNIHEKNEKKKKKKKHSFFYKKTKNVRDPLVYLKNSNVTSDIMQEEKNNLIKLDSYVDILSQKSDIVSLAKQTILLLLKDILNCIPFQMAPSITSKKIYDQKIQAHIKFVYQSKNLFDLMPYFFIFKNIIKQKTLPSNQSLYICNVLLYALFEA
ncbi:conserved Plasmodium protein, unknown function [Plasmodium relictum]|uniref:AP2-coincident C-terminal domain-containing protein n=1 Tax=Plasmodium relictum TaxID=85471 RepID=A0A1J1HBI3_PLARL|nr:conserved Plasmodium protein, unknown function [Plasmodium relictum]CRH02446.1 conserved Plasmodium protein, unknown function [Plasmodium relictum]